jgi:hypothetical protein
VRKLFLFIASLIAGAGLSVAQSHPGWWTFAAPESNSLIGIGWSNLRESPFGDVVRGELSTTGSLGFPDLPCLMNARDFLISSPPLLAGANGGCTPAALKADAVAQGMKPAMYRGIAMWIAPGKTLSVAQISDRVVLIGLRKSLEGAIDRSLAETHLYSPLLMTGARLAHANAPYVSDLWVAATELPDPIAGIFVPLDVPDGGSLHNFEGGLSIHDGLNLDAVVNAGSDKAALEFAGSLRKSIPQLPVVAKGLQVVTNGSSVTLALRVAKAELEAGLRQTTDAQPTPPTSTTPVPITIPVIAATTAAPVPPRPEPVKPEVIKVEVARVEVTKAEAAKSEPQVIRIFGLDDGPREIVLPPKQPR